MGQRIARLWGSFLPELPLRLGTRRARPLAGTRPSPAGDYVTASIEDPDGLPMALADAVLVVNAVGPYEYDPAPVLRACADAGAHYVDLASETQFYAAVRTWAEAPDTRIGVSPGACTVPGLIEVAATALADKLGSSPAAFDAFLSLGSANPLTTGLLASLTQPLGLPLVAGGAKAYRELRWRSIRGLGSRLFGRYPAPFDASGIPAAGRVLPGRFWFGLDRVWIVHALRAGSYLRPRFSTCAWLRLCGWVRRAGALARLAGGAAGGLRVEALDADGAVLAAAEVFAPTEGLNVPALLPVLAAQAMVRSPRRGYAPLRELVTYEEVTRALGLSGCEVALHGR
jgi:hypothetical protein